MIRRVLFVSALLLFLSGCDQKRGTFIETTKSRYSTNEGVKKFEEILSRNGLSIFQIINHAQNAKNVDMELLPNTLVVFGNPKMGSVLMGCNQTMGIDLPLKMLFYTDYDGVNWISYTNPEYYSLKHNIRDKNCLAVITKANLAMQTLVEDLTETNTTKSSQ